MSKTKTLSAVIILSAAIATPAFAQDPGVRHHGSEARHRAAFNQLNGSSNAAALVLDDEDRRDIANYGFSGRDPSRPGGRDPSFNGGTGS